MLLSRHRIGEYMPEVVHRGPDPAAVAVCQDVLDKPGVECVIIRCSRGLSGWDERSNLDLNVIHEAATDSAEPGAALGRAMDRHYRNSFEEPAPSPAPADFSPRAGGQGRGRVFSGRGWRGGSPLRCREVSRCGRGGVLREPTGQPFSWARLAVRLWANQPSPVRMV